MLHPQQFEANEACSAFRMNNALVRRGLAFVARISCFILFSGLCALVLAQQSAGSSDAEILRSLVPEFSDVVLLTMEDLTEEQARKVSTTPGIGRRFEGDLNADGQQDLALFGQYSGGDSLDTFLLIASWQGDGWRRAALLRFPSEFIIGVQYENVEYVLWVGFCTGCDVGGRVVWSGSRYEFVPSQPTGVEP